MATTTIGEKLKKLRLLRNLTQNDLAGEHVSRNMICQIERGAGNPSLQSLKHLAKALSVDPGYFLSEEDDLTKYLILDAMPKIQTALYEERYRECIKLCQPFTEEKNDELCHILALCYFTCGKENYEAGYLESAKSDLMLALQFAKRSHYSNQIEFEVEFFLMTLMERSEHGRFQKMQYPHVMRSIYETFLYRQILDMIEDKKTENAAALYDALSLETVHYRRHINARLSMAGFNYERAKALLHEIIRDREKSGISVPFLMQIYKDLERCYKATHDYEGAYRCSKQLLSFSENLHR